MADGYDKIDAAASIAKKIANILRDPTCGKDMDINERNRIRGEAYTDVQDAIDILVTYAECAGGIADIINLQTKYATFITGS